MNPRPIIDLFILLISLGFIFPTSLMAQTLAPDKAMGRYTHYSWLEQHGLPQNSVTAITQTRDGYLWLGTAEGLVRFDGVRFKVFDSGNTGEIKIKLIVALLEDREGSLWITTGGFGLIRLKDGRFTAYTSKNGLANNDVQAVCEDGDGGLWIGTVAGLNHLKDGKFTAYTTNNGLAGDHVMALLKDRRGNIWVGTRSGLSRFKDGKFSNYTTRQGLAHDRITSFYEDQDGSIWIGTDGGGLSRFSEGRFTSYTTKEGLSDNRVLAICKDYEGSLWVGTSAGLSRLKDGNFSVSTEKDGVPRSEVKSIFEDRERNLWFGALAGGLNLFKDGRFKVLTIKDGLSSDLVWAVCEDQEGGLWIRTNTALNRVKDGKVTTYTTKDGLANDRVGSILPDREGSLWFGTSTGLTRYQNGRFTSFTSQEGLSNNRIISLCEGRDGGLWINTQSGLDRFKYGKFTAYGMVEGWSENFFHRCYEDRQGNLWAGTTTRGLFRFKDGRFVFQDVMTGPPYDQVILFYEDRAGAVWIGTGGGLLRFKDEKFSLITSRNGLYDDLAFQILEDTSGNFWMSCNKGIYRVSAKELNDFADGRITYVNSYVYGTEDGMLSRECNGGQPAGWRTSDGRLWFPTIKGLAGVNPEQLNPHPPSVIIEEVFSDRKPFDHLLNTQIPQGPGEIEIHYTGLSWDVPQRVRFKYKLEGYDQDWVEAGARREAYYTNLAPGRYTFRVKASNNDGVWNETGAAYEFYLRPHFYQTKTFYALCALSLLLFGFAGYRWRVRHLVRQKQLLEARVAERTSLVVEQSRKLAQTNDQLEHANTQLNQANDDLLSTLNQLRLGVAITDGSGRLTFLSEAAERLLNKKNKEVAGRDWAEALPLGDQDLARLKSLAQLPVGQRAKLPVHVQGDGGRRYWMEIEVQDDPRDPARKIFCLYDVSEIYDLRSLLDERARFHDLIGESAAMQIVYKQIQDVAPVETTVLVEGETGTGKELVARAIHYASPRKSRPLIVVNCAGLTESLVTSQLFGHKRGAFTGAVSDQVGVFEAAQGGTLFLDEIGDIPPGVQTALLRVLQEREITRVGESKPRPVDVRVIAATHRNLQDEVASGRFRQDLLYRIRVAQIHLPALRQRRGDIPLLVAWFLGQFRAAAEKSVLDVSQEAMQKLIDHSWPGNIRELRSAIESAVIRCDGHVIQVSDLPQEITGSFFHSSQPQAAQTFGLMEDKKKRVLEAIAKASGNRAAAAKILGISRATLYNWLRDLHIR